MNFFRKKNEFMKLFSRSYFFYNNISHIRFFRLRQVTKKINNDNKIMLNISFSMVSKVKIQYNKKGKN
jgi:hypothetical protein